MKYVHAGSHSLPHAMQVTIRANRNLFEARGKYDTEYRVRSEVVDWLSQHVGTGDVTYSSMGSSLEWHACMLTNTCIFCFRTKDKAALFKLTWQA